MKCRCSTFTCRPASRAALRPITCMDCSRHEHEHGIMTPVRKALPEAYKHSSLLVGAARACFALVCVAGGRAHCHRARLSDAPASTEARRGFTQCWQQLPAAAVPAAAAAAAAAAVSIHQLRANTLQCTSESFAAYVVSSRCRLHMLQAAVHSQLRCCKAKQATLDDLMV